MPGAREELTCSRVTSPVIMIRSLRLGGPRPPCNTGSVKSINTALLLLLLVCAPLRVGSESTRTASAASGSSPATLESSGSVCSRRRMACRSRESGKRTGRQTGREAVGWRGPAVDCRAGTDAQAQQGCRPTCWTEESGRKEERDFRRRANGLICSQMSGISICELSVQSLHREAR